MESSLVRVAAENVDQRQRRENSELMKNKPSKRCVIPISSHSIHIPEHIKVGEAHVSNAVQR
jgi:hypothetical protein